MNWFHNYPATKIAILCVLGSCLAFCIYAETSIKSAFIVGLFLLIIAFATFMVVPWYDDL